MRNIKAGCLDFRRRLLSFLEILIGWFFRQFIDNGFVDPHDQIDERAKQIWKSKEKEPDNDGDNEAAQYIYRIVMSHPNSRKACQKPKNDKRPADFAVSEKHRNRNR